MLTQTRHGDIVVIGEAADAATAHSLFCSLNPHLVVMDITLPGTSGIEAMRRMLAYKADTRVLMFSMHEDAIFAKRALQAGAFGYVTKASAPKVLVEAVHSVASGRKYLSADIARKLEKETHYTVDEKFKQIQLTDEGITKAEQLLGIEKSVPGSIRIWISHGTFRS